MNKYKIVLVAAITAAITGCATATREELTKFDNARLCVVYGSAAEKENVLDEINSRKLFKPNDIPSIQNKQEYLGMSGCAVLAINGFPDRSSVAVTLTGRHITYTYIRPRSGGGWSIDRTYYITNNTLISKHSY